MYMCTTEMGTDPESGYIFGSGFKFSGKIRIRYVWYGVYRM